MPIQGTLAKDTAYTWAEGRSSGAGPRQFILKGPGVDRTWTITPNPHANPAYNKGQEALYKGFATKVNEGWPAKKAATAVKIKEPQDVKDAALKKKLLAMKKEQFDKAAAIINKKAQEDAEAKATTDYLKLVETHVSTKSKATVVKLGDVTYKLTPV